MAIHENVVGSGQTLTQVLLHRYRFRLHLLLSLQLVTLSLSGCVKNQVSGERRGLEHPGTFQPYPADFTEDLGGMSSTLTATLRDIVPGVMDEAKLWAISQCDCGAGAAGQYLQQLVQSRGVLPQVLVPTVREEIANDPKLQLLNSMPPILGGVVKDAVEQIFVSDQNLENEVRSSLSEKLSDSLLTPSLDQSISFRFDAFANPFFLSETQRSVSPVIFDVQEQSVKWSFIFGQDALWSGGQPLALNNHGLQLLAVGQVLAEWQYAFGLERASATQRIYGGLSIDPQAGKTGPLDAFDPRAANAVAPRLISGKYGISYPKATRDVDKVFQVQEQWFREGDRITLEEQAQLWTSSAMAFHRLRPRNRGDAIGAFHKQRGMFPDNTHQLPLIFLSGMGAMLDGPFIDTDTLEIFSEAKLPGFDHSKKLAGPIESMRLARALSFWVKETEDLNDSNLSLSMLEEIANSRTSLLDALRLSMQHVLANFVIQKDARGKHYGYPLSLDALTFIKPTMAQAAEIIATMLQIEQETLPSDLLKEKIAGMVHWFVSEFMTEEASFHLKDPSAVIWTQQVAKRFATYSQYPKLATSWAQSWNRIFESSLQTWSLDGGQP